MSHRQSEAVGLRLAEDSEAAWEKTSSTPQE